MEDRGAARDIVGLFFAEFDNVLGPRLLVQVPEEYAFPSIPPLSLYLRPHCGSVSPVQCVERVGV
jgi:hypothetical protein